MNTNEKDDAIREIIIDLSKEIKETDHKDYISKFKEIYTNEYRHSYAKMYGAIAEVKEEGNIEFLSTNIELLKNKVNDLPNNQISICVKQKINKFYDHVSLECARFLYLDVIISEYEELHSNYNMLLKDSERITSSIEKHNKALDNVDKKINNQNRDILSHMIAIISIFTAVVFTALTSFNLITSIASAVVEKDNFYWVGCVLFTVAFITINIFYVLLKFIGRIIDKAIFAHKNYIVTLNMVLIIAIIVLFVLANKTIHIIN